MDNKIGSAFVELTVKGFQTVAASIKTLKQGIDVLRHQKVDVNIDVAKERLAQLQGRLDRLSARKAQLEVAAQGGKNLKEELERIQAEADKLKGKKIALNLEDATKQLEALDARLDKLNLRQMRIQLRIDSGKLNEGQLENARAKVDKLDKAIGKISYRKAVLEFNVKGLEKVQALRQLNMESVARGFQTVATVATRGFFAAGAAVASFYKQADPLGWENLQVAIAKVSIQIGRFFVPLVREVTERIDRLSSWFKRLTNDQRENVLHWTKIFLVATGTLAVLPRLVSTFGAVSSVVKGLTAGFKLLGVASPLGWIALAVGAFGGLGAAMSRNGKLVDQFHEILKQLGAIFLQAWNAVAPLVETLASMLAPVLGIVLSVVQRLLPYLEALAVFWGVYKIATLAGVAATALLSGAMTTATGAVAGLKAALTSLLANPFALAVAAIATAAMALGGAFSGVGDKVAEAQRKIEELEALLEKLKQGGRAEAKDLRALSAQDRARIQAVANDPKRMREELQKMKQEAEADLKGTRTEEQTAAALAKVAPTLQANKDEQGSFLTKGPFSALKKRYKAIEQSLKEGGMDNGEIQKILHELDTKFGNYGGALNKSTMSDEQIREVEQAINNMARLPRLQAEAKKEFAETGLKQGGVDFNKKKEEKDDKFRGEVRGQAPQLVQIAEAWRKVQQAAGPMSVEDRIKQATLEETKRGNDINERSANANEETARNTRQPAPPRFGW